MPYFLANIEVALVVRRHAHDGAVAIAHQHIVADPDSIGLPVSGCVTVRPVGMPTFSRTASSASVVPPFLHSSMKAASCRVGLRRMRGQRVFGCHGAEGHAHDGVGAGGEDVHAPVADQLAIASRMSCVKAKRTPSLLPIQFSCISLTRSGQPGSWVTAHGPAARCA
jgi:hypothetical protein